MWTNCINCALYLHSATHPRAPYPISMMSFTFIYVKHHSSMIVNAYQREGRVTLVNVDATPTLPLSFTCVCVCVCARAHVRACVRACMYLCAKLGLYSLCIFCVTILTTTMFVCLFVYMQDKGSDLDQLCPEQAPSAGKRSPHRPAREPGICQP